MQTSEILTPQERLALSRKAIVSSMNRRRHDGASESDDEFAEGMPSRPVAMHGITGRLQHAVKSWWYHHPASVAVDLVRPLVSDYAGAHPFKLLAISAGIGAATVLIRPWRMVSVGGLALAGIKSSGLSGMLLSLLTNPSLSSQNNEDLR